MFDEVIVSFVLGELDAEAAAECEARIAASSRLAAAVERLRSALAAMQYNHDDAPTPGGIRRVQELWAQARSRPTLWDRVVHLGYWLARPVFDGRAEPALAGYRSTEPASYQLAFESDAARVDLQVTHREMRGADGWAIHGRIVAHAGTPTGRVALCSTDRLETLAATEPDGHGRFSMELDPGSYDLLVEVGPGAGLVIPDLEIGQAGQRAASRRSDCSEDS